MVLLFALGDDLNVRCGKGTPISNFLAICSFLLFFDQVGSIKTG